MNGVIDLERTNLKNERFYQLVEAGDIAFLDLIPEAFAIFGYTRIGKTTTSHYLCNNHLKAQSLDGQFIWTNATKLYDSAKIGSTIRSETEIPNIFNSAFTSNGTNITIPVIDEPGYGDSHGFYREFANGYFHYRTFSKISKMRFILAFERSNLTGTAKAIRDTIREFTKSFRNYKEISVQILNATTFIITKVEPHCKLQNLVSAFKKLLEGEISNIHAEQEQIYRQMIVHMIGNEKIFMFCRPKDKNQSTPANSMIIKEMYDKTISWSRPTEGNFVDMSDINFSVAGEILDNYTSTKGKIFKEECDCFIQSMNRRMKDLLTSGENSLKNVIKTLAQDCQSQVDSHRFLGCMEELVSKNYTFFNQDSYSKKRQACEARLFESLDENSTSFNPEYSRIISMKNEKANKAEDKKKQEGDDKTKTNYCIKKFLAIDNILRTIREMIQNKNQDTNKRNMAWLENTSENLKLICKQFDRLRIKKEDSTAIIFKYCYLIVRVIEEAKIMTLILYSDPEIEERMLKQVKKSFDIYIELAHVFMEGVSDSIKIDKLKQDFIRRNLQSIDCITPELIQFVNCQDCEDDEIMAGLAIICIKYGLTVLKRNNEPIHDKRFIIIQIFKLSNKLIESEDRDQSHKFAYEIFKLRSILAELLESLKYTELATEVFKSVWNVDKVILLMSERLKLKDLPQDEESQVLSELGEYTMSIGRWNDATVYFQQAQSRSLSFMELEYCANNIIECHRREKSEFYIDSLQERKFYLPLTSEVAQKIEKEFEETVLKE